MLEEVEEREVRRDADERVLRISRDGHDGADVGGRGEGDEVGQARQFQPVRDGKDDGSEDEADSVVDKKGREDADGEAEQNQKFEARAGDGSDADGNPVEEMGDLEMCDQNHDAEEENDGVPVDGTIGGVEGDPAAEDHGDSAAKCSGGAIEMASAAAFDSDENVGDEEDDDGKPVEMREELGRLKHEREIPGGRAYSVKPPRTMRETEENSIQLRANRLRV